MKINTKKSKLVMLFLVLVLSMAAFAGCSSDSDDGNDSDDNGAQQEEVIGEIKVKLSIDFPDTDGQQDVEDKVIGMNADASVLDLLFAYANENSLDVQTEGDDMPYVMSIGGLNAKGDSGWIFTVNDETVLDAAGDAILKDGDEVEWEYTSFDDMD